MCSTIDDGIIDEGGFIRASERMRTHQFTVHIKNIMD